VVRGFKVNEKIIPYIIVVLASSLIYFILTLSGGGWVLWGQVLTPLFGLLIYSMYDLIMAFKEKKEVEE